MVPIPRTPERQIPRPLFSFDRRAWPSGQRDSDVSAEPPFAEHFRHEIPVVDSLRRGLASRSFQACPSFLPFHSLPLPSPLVILHAHWAITQRVPPCREPGAFAGQFGLRPRF